MKPLHIGLLIACSVIAGVVGTKMFTSSPSPAPQQQPAPVVAQPVEQPPAPAPAAVAEPAKPAEEAAPSPFPEKQKAQARKAASAPARPSRSHHDTPKPESAVAQNLPPALPQQQATPPTPSAAALAPAPEPSSSPNTIVHPQPPPPPPPEPHKVTIPVGTLLNARLVEGLSTERNHVGDGFSATLDQPLVVDGFVLAERGSRLQGKVVDVKESGRVKGVGQIGIALTSLHTADGQNIPIQTDTFTKAAASSTKQDVERGAAATGIGAVIGAIAGGGKGAAIGAGIGAAAGVGGAVATRGKPATLATETRLQFRIAQPVTVTEKLH